MMDQFLRICPLHLHTIHLFSYPEIADHQFRHTVSVLPVQFNKQTIESILP